MISKTNAVLISGFLLSVGLFIVVDAHGRFMRPPNRSSIWRVPEFAHLNPPANYDDNQLYCGGLHQADSPGSNCGVCGDPASSPTPRANERGGTYDRGIIVAEYTAGQVIDVSVDLTTSHLGSMQFRLCDSAQETQACFNNNLLRIVGGPGDGGTELPAGPTGMMHSRVQLPSGVRCDRCVIQWNYRAGNGWGDCGNGTSASGCGPQETFRGCSDVRIR